MRQMHADLMRTPGFQLRQHLGMGAEALDDPQVSHRLPAIGPDRHLGAGRTMPANGFIHGAATGQNPQTDGDVAPLDHALRQRRHQRGVGFDRPGHHHQAAGVLVEPVDQACPRHEREARIQA